ncbi:MAG: hypothetical protein KGH98_04600, partial [Candidatus Micrarchaeota archaeon]|nr:hypothetical protein [Candidatus Micrarchaeota archaeon]
MVERLKFLRQKQCRLIKDFLYINELTVRTAAKKLGVSSTALKYWLNEKRTLPLPIFQGLCKISPELSIYKTYVEERLNDNWGQIKGGKNRIKQISNIDRYLTAIRKKRDSKRLTASKQIKSITSPNNELLNIIIRDGVDVLNILATCLLTDGS